MNLLISCSMKNVNKAERLAESLRKEGHVVTLPTTEKLASKRAYIDRHLQELRENDALLLANFIENESEYGRVGASGFFEVGWAYTLGKKAYYLNPLDPTSPYTEDIMATAERFEQDTERGEE